MNLLVSRMLDIHLAVKTSSLSMVVPRGLGKGNGGVGPGHQIQLWDERAGQLCNGVPVHSRASCA